jgi:hypothetical protein
VVRGKAILEHPCAAIVEARERIAALKAAVSRSEKVVARSVERRKSARLLYDSIRRGAGEEFER